MAQNTIAIISDCDATLAPDTTGQLLEYFGLDQRQFFGEAQRLVEDSWDPTLAYFHRMAVLAEDGGPLEALTDETLAKVGGQLEFYYGTLKVFPDLKEQIKMDPQFRDVGIRVETYVVSSGIEELLDASPLRGAVHSIWGSSFAYDQSGRIASPKKAVSFTDKTHSIFLIQKGKMSAEFKNNPYVVNEPMEPHERPVPFKNMIYIGDGPSDIPCMSLIQSNGWFVLGILSQDKPAKTWALGYGRRANITVPPDFIQGGYAYGQLREALFSIAGNIRRQLTTEGPVPKY